MPSIRSEKPAASLSRSCNSTVWATTSLTATGEASAGRPKRLDGSGPVGPPLGQIGLGLQGLGFGLGRGL